MLVRISATWEWIRRFEILTRCADTLEEICSDVHAPEQARRSKIPIVGRLKATLEEADGAATNPQFKSASQGLRMWADGCHFGQVREAFAEAAKALRLEARTTIGRRTDGERRAAFLYQLAMVAETSPGRALMESGIRDDFCVDTITVERWINAAKERGQIEIDTFHPESGRCVKITQRGIETLEDAVGVDCAAAVPRREKQQKFGILDAPNLLKADLDACNGPLGACLLYLDLDNFKTLNARFTERLVDRTLLPKLHGLLDSLCSGNGFAYAEGGDEFVILLPNATEAMASAFAAAVVDRISREVFGVESESVQVTASVGLASSERFALDDLPDAANRAKLEAKNLGKNRVVVAGKLKP